MWLRSAVAGFLGIATTQNAHAQQLTPADFRAPVRFVADIAVDLAFSYPHPVTFVAGVLGKGTLLYLDAKDRKARGATTPQALRDQGISSALQVGAEFAPIGRFATTTKSLAIAATRAGGNNIIANEVDGLYTGLQDSVAPYEPQNATTSLSKYWRQTGTSVRGQVGAGTLQDSACSVSLPEGREIHALARQLVSQNCQSQGLPDSPWAKSAQITASCVMSGFQMSSQYDLMKLNDRQIGVNMRFRIAGEWANSETLYEKCDR